MRRLPLAAALAAAVALAPAGRADEVFPAQLVAIPDGAATDADRGEADARDAAVREEAQGKREVRRVRLPMLGVAVGGGFPDLGTASLVFRPLDSLRFFAGPTWGYVAWGLHGGVVLAPWSGWFTPTISVEAGEIFRTDLSFLAKDQGGVPSGLRPLLAKVDYRYVAGDLGFELGSPRGFAFYLRLGLSFVTVSANGTASYTSDNGTKVSFTDPVLRATLPSVKLGLQYWF